MTPTEGSPEPTDFGSKFRRYPLAELLILLVILVYLPSMHGAFLWDDQILITENTAVVAPGGLHKIWTGNGTLDYLPTTLSLFWAEFRTWGSDTRGYHAVTVSLHALSAVFLALILKRLRVPGAWLGALIFAIHPVAVESVAWIAETKNTLSGVFYFAALLAYLKFEEDARLRTYLLALGAFGIALLSKGSVVTLPFVLLLCAWWLRGRISRTDLLRCAPFFALAVVIGLITIRFQNAALSKYGDETPVLPLAEKLTQAGQIVWFYLSKAILPIDLMTIYPRFTPMGVFPDVALVAVLVALWLYRDTSWGRALCFAVAYYILSLSLVLGFFHMGYSVYSWVADRFQYLALPALAALAGAGISLLARRVKPAAIAAGVALAAALLVATVFQQAAYLSLEALWRNQLRFTPNSSIALTNLGINLIQQGRIPEALECLENASLIEPGFAEAHADRGGALLALGRVDESIIQFREALRLNPKTIVAADNLGTALAKQGRIQEATAQFREALKIDPRDATAHDNLGTMLAAAGKMDEAIQEFRAALAIQPFMAPAKKHLERALSETAH